MQVNMVVYNFVRLLSIYNSLRHSLQACANMYKHVNCCKQTLFAQCRSSSMIVIGRYHAQIFVGVVTYTGAYHY